MFAQDLFEAEAPTAPAVGETRSRKAKEKVACSFAFRTPSVILGVSGVVCVGLWLISPWPLSHRGETVYFLST